jgi:dihydrofolate reductase
MKLEIVVAQSANRVIGQGNGIPWSIPEDMKFFRELTMGHPVIMGRKTYDSIGKPLAGRTNIVVTRDSKRWVQIMNERNPEIRAARSVFDAVVYAARMQVERAFVIGGAEIYQQLLPFANKLHVTLVHKVVEGDTYFPVIGKEWELENSVNMIGTETPFEFQTFVRRY